MKKVIDNNARTRNDIVLNHLDTKIAMEKEYIAVEFSFMNKIYHYVLKDRYEKSNIVRSVKFIQNSFIIDYFSLDTKEQLAIRNIIEDKLINDTYEQSNYTESSDIDNVVDKVIEKISRKLMCCKK